MAQSRTDDEPEIQVPDRHWKRLKKKGYVYYDRDAQTPDPRYIDRELNGVIDLLRSSRRRVLIQRLGELHPEGGKATIGYDELAREIVAIEDDVHVGWTRTTIRATGDRR